MGVQHERVVIIGSGPAGYTAAIYAARAMLKPVMIQGIQPGGQMTITTDVENFPGFADVIQGPWLMEQMQKQAEHVGTRMIYDVITEVDFSSWPFRATGDSGDTYSGDTVIISTGAQARWLGLAAEEKFMGFGLSACATCDGFFFREKEVAVIGGGRGADAIHPCWRSYVAIAHASRAAGQYGPTALSAILSARLASTNRSCTIVYTVTRSATDSWSTPPR